MEERAQGEEIGARVERAALRLLGRHGIGRPEDDPGNRQRRFLVGALARKVLGEAEVEDLGPAGRRHHDVGGLEVAVQDAGFVGFGEPFRDVAAEPGGHRGCKRPFLIEHLAEGLAVDQLHDDPIGLFPFDNVVDVDDGRMIEPGDRLGFTAQPRASVGDGRIGTNPLGGDLAFQPLVPGPPHRAHAAVSERLLQAIRPRLLLQTYLLSAPVGPAPPRTPSRHSRPQRARGSRAAGSRG
jgi:hypothetical protein